MLQGRANLRVGSNCLFRILDLYWRSPESGDLWNTSRLWKRRFNPIGEELLQMRAPLPSQPPPLGPPYDPKYKTYGRVLGGGCPL